MGIHDGYRPLKNTRFTDRDPNFNQVTLLLNGNGTNGAQNNTFLDSSPNNFTITRNGNTTQGTFSPFSLPGGWWSNYFDGNADYLTLPSNANLDCSGDFTFEGWFYQISNPATSTTSGTVFSTAQDKVLSNGQGSTYVLYDSQDRVIVSDRSTLLNKWYHLAISRSGTTIIVYLNGVQAVSFTSSAAYNFSSVTLGYRNISPVGYAFHGYMSNIRIVKGTGLYTSNFIPSTSPLTAITNTSLLTCQDNRFRDGSTNNFTITRNGDVRVTPFSPFQPTAAYDAATNGGSGYFDGTGDYLTAARNSAFAFGTGDFTIEGWIYPTSASGLQTIWSSRLSQDFVSPGPGSDTTSIFIGFRNNTSILDVYTNITVGTSTTALPLFSWTHFVFSRVSGVAKTFINGVETSSNSVNTNFDGDRCDIGRLNNNSFPYPYSGYISDLRVVKGSGVTSVTVPTAPLTAITNTSVLLNFTNAGIIDAAGDNVIETVGNAQIDTAIKQFGSGSLEFDGNGDYLLLPGGENFAFGTGDFTVEFWVNSNTTGSAQGFYSSMPTSTDGAYLVIEKNSSNTVQVYVNASARITGSVALSASTWYHVAVARQGTSTKLFINGTQDGSTWTDTTNYINGANRPVIGANGFNVANLNMNGYIDDLRVTKGIARYTANFTPPVLQLPRR